MDIQNLIEHEISDFFASLGSPDVNDYIFSGDAECDLMRRILPLVTELQQRIEKAAAQLAERDIQKSQWASWANEASAEVDRLRAQLAELAAQEPVFEIEVSGNHWLNAGPVDDSDFTSLPDGINQLYTRPAPPAPVVVKLPEVETWRSVDAVRAQNAYRVLVRNAIETAGGSVEGE